MGYALGREPVGALPTAHDAEHRARSLQPVVQGRAPGVSGRLGLQVGPVHAVQRAYGLHRAVGQVSRMVLVAVETTDVHLGQVHRRVAGYDPLRDGLADPGAGGDAGRVQPRGDEEPPELRGLSHDVSVVGREALRADVEPVDAGFLHRRDTVGSGFPEDLEVVPVGLKQAEVVPLRDAVRAPRLGTRLEAPHEDGAPLFLVAPEVDLLVRVAQRLEVVRDFHRVGHEVHVLGRVERDVHPAQLADLPGPHAGAVDRELALDGASVRRHAGDRAVPLVDARYDDVLEQPDAIHRSAGGQRLRRMLRQRLAVLGDVERAGQVVGPHQRPHFAGLSQADRLDLDPEGPAQRGDLLQLVHAAFGPGDGDAARLAEPGGMASLGLQSAIEIDSVLGDLDQRPVVAKLGNQAGRVPRGAAGQLASLEDHYVSTAQLRQVVGDATADDSTSDDDDLGTVGKIRGH